MRFRYILLFPIFLLLGCQPSSEKAAIERQLQDYPETRVQDIYKSFCQDNLGPGHLIPDQQSAKNYLESELRAFKEDLDSARFDAPGIMYSPVGDRMAQLATSQNNRPTEPDILRADMTFGKCFTLKRMILPFIRCKSN